jgi:hypothetical protein
MISVAAIAASRRAVGEQVRLQWLAARSRMRTFRNEILREEGRSLSEKEGWLPMIDMIRTLLRCPYAEMRRLLSLFRSGGQLEAPER